MDVIIVGCGRVGAELATLLSGEGHNVTIIDKNPSSLSRLGKTFNGIRLVGNGIDRDILLKAGISTADAFVMVTDGDNTNIMASEIAKKIFKVPKVTARLYDARRAEIYKRLGLSIISGTTLVASQIRDKLIESHFSSYFTETKGMGTIEINITDKFANKKVKNFNRKDEFLIATIIKKVGPILPTPNTILEKGDVLIGIVRIESLKKIKKLFELKE
ncbi:potassium channel family protein [Candidatus Margulisiibacteriota bacterium]